MQFWISIVNGNVVFAVLSLSLFACHFSKGCRFVLDSWKSYDWRLGLEVSYSYWPPPTFLLPALLLLNSTAAMNVCQEGGVAQGLLVTRWGRAAGSLPDKFIAFHVYHCHRGIGQNEEKYIQWQSLFLSNEWQHIFEDTAHCWKAKREKDDQHLFSATKPTFIGRCTSLTPKPLLELLHSKLKSRHLEENVRS